LRCGRELVFGTSNDFLFVIRKWKLCLYLKSNHCLNPQVSIVYLRELHESVFLFFFIYFNVHPHDAPIPTTLLKWLNSQGNAGVRFGGLVRVGVHTIMYKSSLHLLVIVSIGLKEDFSKEVMKHYRGLSIGRGSLLEEIMNLERKRFQGSSITLA
jgi:hypothetical protein